MELVNKQPSSYEVLSNVDSALKDQQLQYYTLGQLATEALIAPPTTIDHDKQQLITDRSLFLSTNLENGTKRTLSLLFLDKLDQQQTDAIHHLADQAAEHRLNIQVYHPIPHQEAFYAKDWGRHTASRYRKAFRLLTSSATQLTIGSDRSPTLRLELYPFSVDLPQESFEQWKLKLPNGHSVPMLNPAAHMLTYAIHHLSGVQPEQQTAYLKMRQRIYEDEALTEQLIKGNLKPWYDFYTIIKNLNEHTLKPEYRPGAHLSVAELAISQCKAYYFRRRHQSRSLQDRQITGNRPTKQLTKYASRLKSLN